MVWIRKAREQNCILTGSIIQTAAVRIVQEPGMGELNFKASNGWFENFKERHQIVNKALQGERADAPVEQANNFKARLPQLLSMYDPHDIFNVDEVGLFYEQAGKRTFLEQGEDPAGGKVSKKRMTILLWPPRTHGCH